MVVASNLSMDVTQHHLPYPSKTKFITDDSQSYTHYSASHDAATVRSMLCAIDALTNWMSSIIMCLNQLKTQYIWFGTHQEFNKLDLRSLALEFSNLLFSTCVWNLGVILDQELSFVEHFKTLTRSCYYQLHQLRVVVRFLSPLLHPPWFMPLSLTAYFLFMLGSWLEV